MSEPPVVTPFTPPRFGVEDPAGYAYLEENGYVVFKDVLTPAQVEQGRSLAWDFLESLPNRRISRSEPETWGAGWPDPFGKGILVSDGVGQSEFMWFNRSQDTVQTVFRTIWQTPDIATSFDGFGIFRPTEYNPAWATDPGRWYHVDQDGITKPDKVCVQGLVNYYDSLEADGGFVCVPGSHNIFAEIFRNRPSLGNQGDYAEMTSFGPSGPWQNEIKAAGLRAVKLCFHAGDMLLWDSRVIHCNSPPAQERPLPSDGSVLPPRRLVAYVCMTPASRLTEPIKDLRRRCYKEGYSTTHWPELANISGGIIDAIRGKWRPPQLSPSARKLVPLEDDHHQGEQPDN